MLMEFVANRRKLKPLPFIILIGRESMPLSDTLHLHRMPSNYGERTLHQLKRCIRSGTARRRVVSETVLRTGEYLGSVFKI